MKIKEKLASLAVDPLSPKEALDMLYEFKRGRFRLSLFKRNDRFEAAEELQHMTITTNDIRLALQSALIGEIYPAIRAIVFFYNSKEKSFKLRYYLDRTPADSDFENADCVLTEFIANFSFLEFDTVKSECVYSLAPFSQIDIMDGIVFRRKENIT